MFLCFIKLFYSHNRSKDTGHFNVKSFRKCTHSERGGSHLEWTASLCIFSVPALWNSSPTAHHNDAILHSPKQPLCSALHSKMSIQKEGTSKWKGREWNIRVHCVIANSGAEKNDPSAPTYCWERQKVPRSTVGHPITRTKVHRVSWKSPDHGIQASLS